MVALVGAATTGTRAESLNHAGTVTAVAGTVTVSRLAANPQPLKFRDTLFWRDVVEARKDGIARILLGGKTTITLRELSSLELREEVLADGIRYTAELVSGKVRASVARMLMRPGDQVEVRTRNAVASVRGTDFIVETVERPGQAGAFGLLGVLDVAQGVADRSARTGETVVVTLSGVVEVTNRLTGAGRAEQVGAYQALRVSGVQELGRVQLRADDMKVLLAALTPPRPQEARSGDNTEAVGKKVEGAALAVSAQSVRVLERAGGNGRSRAYRRSDDSGQGSSQGNPNRSDTPASSQSSSKADKPDGSPGRSRSR